MSWSCGPEFESGQRPADLVGPACVGPADETLSIVEVERPALPVGEEIDLPVDPEAQLPQFGFEHFAQCCHRRRGPDGVEELGPGLDAQGGKVAAGRDADARHVVVEAEPVLPPPVGSDAEGALADPARSRSLGLGRPGSAVFEAGQEPLRKLGPTREVEGVDPRGQLPRTGFL